MRNINFVVWLLIGILFCFTGCESNGKTEQQETLTLSSESNYYTIESIETENAETDVFHEVQTYQEYEAFTISGTIEENTEGFKYILRLDNPVRIEKFPDTIQLLYFNWAPDELSYGTGASCVHDGNSYPFDVSAHIGHRCIVTTEVFNYRASGQFIMQYPEVICGICKEQDCIAVQETDIETDLSMDFYMEVYSYFIETYSDENGCEWWTNPELRIDSGNGYMIEPITKENYSTELKKIKYVIDGLVDIFRLQKLDNSRERLKIGLYFAHSGNMYFCYLD